MARKDEKPCDNAGSGEYAGFYRIGVFCTSLERFEVKKWCWKAVIARRAVLSGAKRTTAALCHR